MDGEKKNPTRPKLLRVRKKKSILIQEFFFNLKRCTMYNILKEQRNTKLTNKY